MSIINRRDRNKFSDVLNDKLPEFVRQDHRTFVSFLETYYKWLESEDNNYFAPQSTAGVLDVDTTPYDYVTHFKKQYLADFPEQLAVDSDTNKLIDERGLIKRIREFYQSKGTKKSIITLFQILFDAYTEIYEPQSDILAPSDGKWIQPTIIRVTNGIKDYRRLIGKKISQKNAAGDIVATAVVDNIESFNIETFPVLQLHLVEVFGSFEESISPIEFIVDSQEIVKENIYSLVAGITFSNGGVGYKVDDKITVTKTSSVSGDGIAGYGLEASVEAVVGGTGSKAGQIRRIRVSDPGINYQSIDLSLGVNNSATPITYTVSIDSELGTGAAGLALELGTKTKLMGYWLDNNGKPSSTEYLHDNWYYQQHSYVIKTERPYDDYIDPLKKIVHPVGKVVHGEILLTRVDVSGLTAADSIQAKDVPVIGHYTPYSLATLTDGATYTSGLDWVLPSHIDLREVRFYDGTTHSAHAGTTVEMGDYFRYGYEGNTATGPIDNLNTMGHGHEPVGTTGARFMNEWTNRYTIKNYTQSDLMTNSTGGIAETTYGNGLSAGSEMQREFTNPVYDGEGLYAGYGVDNVGLTASGWTSGTTCSSPLLSENFKTNWWHIYRHPNKRGINNIPAGMTWGAITLNDFFWMVSDHGPGYPEGNNSVIQNYNFGSQENDPNPLGQG